MYESTVESFTYYCDNYTIANEGLGSTIKRVWDWIVEKVKWIKDKIVQFIKRLFGKSADEEAGEKDGSTVGITQKQKEVIHESMSILNNPETTLGDLKKVGNQVDAVMKNAAKQFEKAGDEKSAQAVEEVIEELREVKEEINTPTNTQVHIPGKEAEIDVTHVKSIKGKLKGILSKATYYTESARVAASSKNGGKAVLDTKGYIYYVKGHIGTLNSAKSNVDKIIVLAANNNNDEKQLTSITDDVTKVLDQLNQESIDMKNKQLTSNNRYYDKKEVKAILMQIDQMANQANGWKPNVDRMMKTAEADKNAAMQKALKAATKYINTVTTFLNMVCAAIIGKDAEEKK